MAKIDRNLIVGIATDRSMKYGALVLSHMSFKEMQKSNHLEHMRILLFSMISSVHIIHK